MLAVPAERRPSGTAATRSDADSGGAATRSDADSGGDVHAAEAATSVLASAARSTVARAPLRITSMDAMHRTSDDVAVQTRCCGARSTSSMLASAPSVWLSG